MIYLIFTLILIFFTYVEAYSKCQEYSNLIAIGGLFLMLALVSLRDKVGTDWPQYYDAYKNLSDVYEISYSFLNTEFSRLGFHFNVFILFLNSISLMLMYFFLKRHTPLMIIGLLMFFTDLFLYYNFSGIRQAIALSITCFSFKYSLERHFFKFLILVLIATTFHSTAISFLIVYFLPRNSLTKKQSIILFLGFIAFNVVLQFMSSFFELYEMTHANYYMNIELKADNLKSLYLVGIAKRSILIIVVFILRKKVFQIPNFNYFFNVYILGVGIYISTYLLSPDIGTRLGSFFNIFDIVIVGNIIYSLKNSLYRFVIVSFFIAMALYKIKGYMEMEDFTYHTIFGF